MALADVKAVNPIWHTAAMIKNTIYENNAAIIVDADIEHDPAAGQDGQGSGGSSQVGEDGVSSNGGDDYARSLCRASASSNSTKVSVGHYCILKGDIKSPNRQAWSKANGLARIQQTMHYDDAATKTFRWSWEVRLSASVSPNQNWRALHRQQIRLFLNPYNDVTAKWKTTADKWEISGTQMVLDPQTGGLNQSDIDPYLVSDLDVTLQFRCDLKGQEEVTPAASYNYDPSHWWPDTSGAQWQNYGYVCETTNPPYSELHNGESHLKVVNVVQV